MTIFILQRRIKTKVRTAARRAKKTFRKYNSVHVKRRILGISLISRMASLMFALALVPASAAQTATSAPELVVNSNLRLSTSTFGLVHLPEISPVGIEITESEYERIKREEAARRTPARVSSSFVSSRPSCPDSFRDVYQKAGAAFGVPWQILEAIHQLESGKSCYVTRRSYAGATGPMQFMPATFRRYAVDGDGDGRTDINNVYDAIYTAAHYVGTGLTGGSLYKAIWNYNHADWYVQKVLVIAREIGFES